MHGEASVQEVYIVKFTKVKKVKLLGQGQMHSLNLNGHYQILLQKGCRYLHTINFRVPVF